MRQRLRPCTRLEKWHSSAISVASVHCAKTAITVPIELRFGHILSFRNAKIIRDAKISVPGESPGVETGFEILGRIERAQIS